MSKNEIPYKIYLSENELPKEWYNVRAEMKNKPAPLLHPATHKPIGLNELTPIFCEELAKQELNDTDKWIEIPEDIRKFYKMFRPSPRTVLKSSSARLQRFTTSLKETTPAEATNLILRLRKPTTRKNKV